jgi:lipocalin
MHLSLLLLLLLLLATAVDAACKPVRTMAPFNVSWFVEHKWFVQAQQPIKYLPKNEIYCVTAEYKQTSATSVDVHNYANSDRVNGKVSDSGGTLQAMIKDPAFPAKLQVGPKFLPHLLYGPYWVVASGHLARDLDPLDHYDWAIISGGQPSKVSENTCGAGKYELFGQCVATSTGSGPGELCDNGEGINNSGLWVFSATQEMAAGELKQLVEQYVVGNGIDPSVLLRVNQTGCAYAPKNE